MEKWILPVINSKVAIERRGGFIEQKPIYVSQIPIPKIAESDQQPLIQKADIMLAKNKELNHLKTRFIGRMQSRFSIKKFGKNLQDWNQLTWEEFLSALKKKKVKLSLKQEDEWQSYFEEKKEEAKQIQKLISKTDKEIDEMVYQLYGLTQEEIEIVEQ